MAQTLSAPSPRGASDAERTAVVGKAVVRAAEALGLTGAELARTLGLSDASVSRLKAGTFALEPSSKAYELALLLIRLFRGLDAMTGGEEPSARGWMTSANRAFADQSPRNLIQSVTGLVAAVEYVDAARARV